LGLLERRWADPGQEEKFFRRPGHENDDPRAIVLYPEFDTGDSLRGVGLSGSVTGKVRYAIGFGGNPCVVPVTLTPAMVEDDACGSVGFLVEVYRRTTGVTTY
jgi:hypothetical protein